MSALESARDRFLAQQERFAAARGAEPGWLAGLRAQACEHFREQGLPQPRQEEWRYTSLAAFARAAFEAPAAGRAAVARADLEAAAAPVFACSLHVFVDGHYDPRLSALGARSEVHVESLAGLLAAGRSAEAARLGRLADTKAQPFAALNTAFLGDAAVLRAPRGAQAAEPLHVVFVSSGGAAPRARHPRVLVVAEAGSRVQLIQDFVSLGEDAAFTNSVTEVFAEPDAQVELVLLQREGTGVFHFANVAASLERGARFSSHALTLGGRLVRNDLAVTLAGEGAEVTLGALYVAGGEQVVDHHTLVDHAAPHGTSRQLYKGVLGGAARGVFRGRVVVRPGAQKTDARQSNPNLLLSDAAEVDSKPQLEIHADDVRCSHGSSIGQLQEDALFYLRARGIAEEDARRLVTRGFAHEILAGLPIPALRDGLDAALDAALAAAGRAGA
jgi:Fe-S cluster assembly protein SufD